MKPRTKLQRQVIAYSQSLHNIDREILEWAKRDCLDHKGFATKTRVICMDCGQRFSSALVSRKCAVCPHCGAKLKMEDTRRRNDRQSMYIAMAEICGEFQVIRNFELIAYYKDGKEPRYYICEILQHWIKENGSREVVARSYNMSCITWSGELEIREKHTTGYYGYDKDIFQYKFHPDSAFKPQYTRYGIDHKLQGISFLKAIQVVPYSPQIETLIKARQYELLEYCNNHSGSLGKYWPSIKICLRNKYKIKDISMWFDYLQLLERCHKDLHNAYYVCPVNLKKAHDTYMAKKMREDEKERREKGKQRLLKLKKEAENYIKDKSKFFDLKISDGKIVIVVLKSIDEFMQEGEKMHHCVFTNEYFKKKDCLILSARIGKKHIETVEVNLKTLQVVQSRGVCNKNTEYHNRIIGLVKQNIGLIRKKMAS